MWVSSAIWAPDDVVHLSLLQHSIDFTPMSDQDRISPHIIDTISRKQVMRMKRNINEGIIS